jgi:uncharacterized protein with von Willebrand factor type A (vWA) domain
MEQKHQETAEKINKLQQILEDSARRIQRGFRKYMMKKKTRAALKIQKMLRRYLAKIEEERRILNRVKRMFASYKVYYFLKAKCLQPKKEKKTNKFKQVPYREPKKSVSRKVVSGCQRYMVAMSAFQA